MSFIDSDQEIEKSIGCTIREYFEREGEESFRDVEQSTLAGLTSDSSTASGQQQDFASDGVVLSTGGGAVLRAENRQALRSCGQVVYLHSQPDDIFKRLRHDRNRPLLQVGDPLQRLRDLYTVRDPLYRETAHFVVETGRPSVATLVNMIVMQLELSGTQK
jgi:shikimate kinase